MNFLVTRSLPHLKRCAAWRRIEPQFGNATQMVNAAFVGHIRLMSSDTDFKPSEELAKERYDSRSGEDIERKRARLLYQSRKRGMLENGVILASFADKFLGKLNAEQLDQYDRLINLPTNDWDIYYWATRTKPTPIEFETPVLEMLREHLNSKVSSDVNLSEKVLGKSKLDDIVLPAVKDHFELEIDVHEVDLQNYKSKLFDHRKKKFASGESMTLMTEWRKKELQHRLKRAVSSPTSLAALSDNDKRKKNNDVYTQTVDRSSMIAKTTVPTDLIETEYEKSIKHHNLLQHILSGGLTDDALDYDDETEAWTDMLWHRNYGTDDDMITPVKELQCSVCKSTLHCCDTGLYGYLPKEIYISIGVNKDLKPENLTCQRCKFSSIYDANLSLSLTPDKYEIYLKHLSRDKSAIFIVLIDLTDFPSGIWSGLINHIKGWNKRVLIVGNKLDLLPYDGPRMINRVKYSLLKNLQQLKPGERNLYIDDITLISARTGFGIPGLIGRILSFSEDAARNVYLIGSDNSGKSTLFDTLLQSDLCAVRKGDLISRVSTYSLGRSEVKLLRFPIELAEGWEVEMIRRKVERVERNMEQQERSLSILTDRRQKSMPHVSRLINKLEYISTSHDDGTLMNINQSDYPLRPNFSDDHPMRNIEEKKPLSADEKIYEYNSFCYHTPSSTHPNQVHDLLTQMERLEVFPNETIIPRKYSLRPLQTIFIAGLARLDLLTSQSSVFFTVFASKYLPVHVIETRKADKFYNQFLGSPYLGVPFGDEVRLSAWPDLINSQPDFNIRSRATHLGCADIVLSSIGWTLINMSIDHECIVRAYTPEGRGIFLRDPPLLTRSGTLMLGKKIRDTPVFDHPIYRTRTRPLEFINQTR